MKIVKLLGLIICSLLLASCTCKRKVKCAQLEVAANVASTAAANFMACKNPDAIKKDILVLLENGNYCMVNQTDPEKQTVSAPIVCEAVANFIATSAIGATPIAWQCSGGVAASLVKTAVFGACSSLLIAAP